MSIFEGFSHSFAFAAETLGHRANVIGISLSKLDVIIPNAPVTPPAQRPEVRAQVPEVTVPPALEGGVATAVEAPVVAVESTPQPANDSLDADDIRANLEAINYVPVNLQDWVEEASKGLN
jgi:hypothetical protein